MMNEPVNARPSRLWIGLTLFFAFGLGLSLLLNLLLSVAVAGHGGTRQAGFSATLVDGKADEKDFIAIVPVQGLIMEPPSDNPGRGSYSQMAKLLRQLGEEENLKGILLVIDSPGGGVTTSDRMYEELLRFKSKKKIPVVAHFEDVAASGGYYVAMAADHVIAHRTSVTGSIGVISRFYNVSELMDRFGVEVSTIKSLNSKGLESFKDIGSPYRKMRPEEKALMQKLVTEMWDRFVQVVAEGRKGKLSPEQIKKLADGRVFTGAQALELKLVDQLGYTHEAYQEVRKRAGNDKARIVRYLPEKRWGDLFSAKLEASQTPLFELPRSRFLYLWDPH